MSELHALSALQQRELLQTGQLRPTELTQHYLDRIARLNPTLGAMTAVTGESAMERASALENQGRPSRHASPLWGMPFADKDLNERAGVATTFGSRAFVGYVSQQDSPIVADMDDAGGVSLGKTNVPEFGFPSYSENQLPGGFARNPWDLNADPGGSSSGAATAVSARLLPFAPGNDAGGSVRIPAAATGLVGLKPSRGRVPGESGIASLAGLAVGGPLARSVADAALLLDGMTKGRDRYSLRAPAPAGMPPSRSFVDALRTRVGPLRIGWNMWSPWATDYEIEVDPQVRAVFEDTLALAGRLGHRVEKVSPTPGPQYVAAFRSVWMAGAAALPLTEEMLEHVEPLTRWLHETGRGRPAGDLPRGLMGLSAFEAQIIADYAPFDLVLTPALGMLPRPLGWYDQHDGETNFMQQCQFTPFTSYLNVAGLPALSLPVGHGIRNGVTLPVGVQVIGRPGDETTLLRFGAQLEEELDWASRVPQNA